MTRMLQAIDPDELLLAYRLGIFPMAETANAKDVVWVRPHQRGILPLNAFHVPHRLARTIRSDRFEVRVDSAFGEVVRGCAEAREGRRDTWINAAIVDVFEILYRRKFAHSVECWFEGNLVGGLYGLAIGGAFFAESKFSRMTDASKVALVHLAARLKFGGYTLLDAQFPNPHLTQFGAIAISEDEFERLLDDAIDKQANFYGFDAGAPVAGRAGSPSALSPSGGEAVASSAAGGGSSVLQVITQMS